MWAARICIRITILILAVVNYIYHLTCIFWIITTGLTLAIISITSLPSSLKRNRNIKLVHKIKYVGCYNTCKVYRIDTTTIVGAIWFLLNFIIASPSQIHIPLIRLRQDTVDWYCSQTRLEWTARDRSFLYIIIVVCYKRVNLCSKMINIP